MPDNGCQWLDTTILSSLMYNGIMTVCCCTSHNFTGHYYTAVDKATMAPSKY